MQDQQSRSPLDVMGITKAATLLAARGQAMRLDIDPLSFADGRSELRLLATFTLQHLIGPDGAITSAWPILSDQLQHQQVIRPLRTASNNAFEFSLALRSLSCTSCYMAI